MLNFFILNSSKQKRPEGLFGAGGGTCSQVILDSADGQGETGASHTVWVPNAFAFVVQSTKVPPNKKDRLGLLVRVVGLEPTRSCLLRILSPVRLPFRHTRERDYYILKML